MNRGTSHNQHYFHPIAQAPQHQNAESATQHAQEVLSRSLNQQAVLPHLITPYSQSLRTSSGQRRTSQASASQVQHHFDKHTSHIGSPHTPISQHGSLPGTPVGAPNSAAQLDMSAVAGLYGSSVNTSPYLTNAATNYTFSHHPQNHSPHTHDPRYDSILLGQTNVSRNVVGMMDTRGPSMHSRQSIGDHDFKIHPEHMSMHNPVWSDSKTKAGKDRKRLPLACIACRRKKIRCSGEKPACRHCLRSRIPCVYKQSARKTAPRTDYMAMLDRRMKRMEERLIKMVPKDQVARVLATSGRSSVRPAPSAAAAANVALAPGAQVSKTKKRSAMAAFGEDLQQWAERGDGGKNLAAAQQKGELEAESEDSDESIEGMPSKEIQEHLAEVYFSYVYGQAYLLLHKPSFMRKLRAGKVPPVLILAVCAVSARFSRHVAVRHEPAFMAGEKYAETARAILMKNFDQPNLTNLVALLILSTHEFATCQGGRSWSYGGMATRMAIALQLHQEFDMINHKQGASKRPDLSWVDREIRRRTMWACFVMDRFNATGTERPLALSEQDMEIQLPCAEDKFVMEVPAVTSWLPSVEKARKSAKDLPTAEELAENMGVGAYIVRAVALYGRIVKYITQTRSMKELLADGSEFASLCEDTQSEIDKLPESLAYNTENLQTHSTKQLLGQFMLLHITNAHSLLFLHRFSIPVTPGGRAPRNIPAELVLKSQETAMRAANTISNLLQDAQDRAPNQVVAPFIGYCAYASSSIHIHGVFSSNAAIAAPSKRNLAVNLKFLMNLRKYWGIFHYMAENLREMYRQCQEAATNGQARVSEEQDEQDDQNEDDDSTKSPIMQYGDWFSRYPQGVSPTEFPQAASHAAQRVQEDNAHDATLSDHADLQTAEEFLATPPTATAIPSKKPRSSTHADTIMADATAAHRHVSPSDELDAAIAEAEAQAHQPHYEAYSLHSSTHPSAGGSSNDPVGFLFDAFATSTTASHPAMMATGTWGNTTAGFEQTTAAPSFADQGTSSGWFLPFNLSPPAFEASATNTPNASRPV